MAENVLVSATTSFVVSASSLHAPRHPWVKSALYWWLSELIVQRETTTFHHMNTILPLVQMEKKVQNIRPLPLPSPVRLFLLRGKLDYVGR